MNTEEGNVQKGLEEGYEKLIQTFTRDAQIIAARLSRFVENDLKKEITREREILAREIDVLANQAQNLTRRETELSHQARLMRETAQNLMGEIARREKQLSDREAELTRQADELHKTDKLSNTHLSETTVLQNIARAGGGDFQTIAASQIEIGESYYKRVLLQAKQSFWLALGAAIVGIVFFLIASGLIFGLRSNLSNVSLISGVVVEVISGIGFVLYAHASRQLAAFHVRLDRTLLFLFANTVCEHLKGDIKEQTRSELVMSMANLSQPQIRPIQPQVRNKKGDTQSSEQSSVQGNS